MSVYIVAKWKHNQLDDLFHLLESDDEDQHRHVQMIGMNEWIKSNPKCVILNESTTIDINLTINPNLDDELMSGHIFMMSDNLFLTIQYDQNNKGQYQFAKAFLESFGVKGDNIFAIDSKKEKLKKVIDDITKLLKEKNLKIEVGDEWKIHQEILFIVKDK